MTKSEREMVNILLPKPLTDWVKVDKTYSNKDSLFTYERDGYNVCRTDKIAIAIITPQKHIMKLWCGYSKQMNYMFKWFELMDYPIIPKRIWDRMLLYRKYTVDKVNEMIETINKKII